jgi:hypothetical protein
LFTRCEDCQEALVVVRLGDGEAKLIWDDELRYTKPGWSSSGWRARDRAFFSRAGKREGWEKPG